ncbi:MAG TPA: hypothetical protein VL382_06460 [Terriglobales bacterium]|nr:hypothetical protein [Terriglobales bacterium]
MGESRVSWVEIVLAVVIVGMILVIARPGTLRSRRPANEEEAIGALRTLATVETIYSNRHPSSGYTCSLDDLSKEALIDAKLASGSRSGYRLRGEGCRSTDPKSNVATEYRWYADPINAETGTRHFCLDQTKVVRATDDPEASCFQDGTEQ